jgi:hypothetical protein
MKLVGIVLLSIASIAVLVGYGASCRCESDLGLGIDVPNSWAESSPLIDGDVNACVSDPFQLLDLTHH